MRSGSEQKIKNMVEGTLNGRPLKIFTFIHTIGLGDNSRTFTHTTFILDFKGNFPHLYLNCLHNGLGFSKYGEHISLPHEAEKKYRLYGPKEYEIEALQVFTEDVLAYLLDAFLHYDIELVDKKLFIFVRPHIDSGKNLAECFSKICGLIEVLARNLDKIKFSKIGDYNERLIA